MDSRYLKVEGHQNLFRDTLTGAIINTDKVPQKSFSKQFNNVMEDINNLKEEMSEIKHLLRELVKNASNT